MMEDFTNCWAVFTDITGSDLKWLQKNGWAFRQAVAIQAEKSVYKNFILF